MSDTVIQVENIGKKYIIGHQQQESYTALRDVIANKVKSLGTFIQNPKSKIQNSQEEFWALKDVSFDIKQGDRVGIIGRNGAGKSTLLKILSRITEPTQGSIKIKGRVASLLEVGTGFHPELTGRENIYLNGAILGMSKVDIKRKFDDIVAFAEVEKFLDTPVKRYSSGMYVRLAFAVAAHLEPEILIIDEVLAVGDTKFQRKCLGKMGDITQEGKTLLFVSHSMETVQKLCHKSIFLEQGQIQNFGETVEVINSYLISGKLDNSRVYLDSSADKRLGSGKARFRKVSLHTDSIEAVSEIQFRQPFLIEIEYDVFTEKPSFNSIAFSISKTNGEIIFTSHHDDCYYFREKIFSEGAWIARAKVNKNILKPGLYFIHIGITDENWNTVDYCPEVLMFEVLSIEYQSSYSSIDRRPGMIIFEDMDWEIKQLI